MYFDCQTHTKSRSSCILLKRIWWGFEPDPQELKSYGLTTGSNYIINKGVSLTVKKVAFKTWTSCLQKSSNQTSRNKTSRSCEVTGSWMGMDVWIFPKKVRLTMETLNFCKYLYRLDKYFFHWMIPDLLEKWVLGWQYYRTTRAIVCLPWVPWYIYI